MPQFKTGFFGIALLAGAGLLSGCSGSNAADGQSESANEPVAETTQAIAAATKWVTPLCNPSVTQPLGNGPLVHLGEDLVPGAGCDWTVMAMADGLVQNVGFSKGNGNYVQIRHTTRSGKTVYSFYAHLSSRAVSAGATVSAGQKIGVMGDTGNSSGAHLHAAVTTSAVADLWGYVRGKTTYSEPMDRIYVRTGWGNFYSPLAVAARDALPEEPAGPDLSWNATALRQFNEINPDTGAETGHYISKGDKIKVTYVSPVSHRFVAEYPVPGGTRTGWFSNSGSGNKITYRWNWSNNNKGKGWKNGHTPETVYNSEGQVVGTIKPHMEARPLFRGSNGRLYVVYSIKHDGRIIENGKSGFVVYNGGFKGF